MHTWQKPMIIAALATAFATGGLLYAQPAASPDDTPPEASLPMEAQVALSPKEMLEQSAQLIDEMKTMLAQVITAQQAARTQKDILRLDCVNDRLLQIKKLLNIAEGARLDLIAAAAGGDQRERQHQYNKVTISHDQVSVLRAQAEGCVGEQLDFVDPTQIDVDAPVIADDPTEQDPLDLAGEPLERPVYASPFL